MNSFALNVLLSTMRSCPMPLRLAMEALDTPRSNSFLVVLLLKEKWHPGINPEWGNSIIFNGKDP